MLSVELSCIDDSPTPLAFSLSLETGQGIIGIMGPSGCGKTTLLRVLAGLESRYLGKVVLDDRVLWSTQDNINIRPHQRNIGLVFQDARLFPHLSVLGNLEFACKRRQRTLFSIEQVTDWFGLDRLLDKPTGALSGGQKQRVAVARAMLHCPQLLLLDEPFVSLDLASRHTLLKCLKTVYRQTQIPMVLVSHDVNDIRQLCDHLLLMDEGKLINQGETFTLLNQLQTGLALSGPIAATLRCQMQGKLDNLPLTRLQVGEQQLLASDDVELGVERVECLIKATDVSISLAHVSDCSIANCLTTTLSAITPLDEHNAVLTLQLSNQVLYAQITRYSIERLNLSAQMTVYALIKASAVSII